MVGKQTAIHLRLLRVVSAAALCAALVGAGASPTRADPLAEAGLLKGPLPEYLVKAAFLYNFARFTEWPERSFSGPADPIRLCVLGRDPFGAFMDSLKGRNVGNRKIRIIHLLWADEAAHCHMLFLSRMTDGRLDRIFKFLDGKPTLTISDWPDPVRAGGVIGLEVIGRKVRFRINVDAAKNAGVKLSSQLLNLAVIVRDRRNADLAGSGLDNASRR